MIQTHYKAFIPNENVSDFSEFCRLNPGPFPVLHRSYESNDFNAEPLTNEFSDARTDAAGYEVYIAGNRQEAQKYLLPAAKYENLQVFYLGCSFGFEKALLDNGVAMRNIDQGRNVSMYRTNIKMNQVAFFVNLKDHVVTWRSSTHLNLIKVKYNDI